MSPVTDREVDVCPLPQSVVVPLMTCLAVLVEDKRDADDQRPHDERNEPGDLSQAQNRECCRRRVGRNPKVLRDKVGEPDEDECPSADEKDVRHVCRGEGLAQ